MSTDASPHPTSQFACHGCGIHLTAPPVPPGEVVEGPCPQCGTQLRFEAPAPTAERSSEPDLSNPFVDPSSMRADDLGGGHLSKPVEGQEEDWANPVASAVQRSTDISGNSDDSLRRFPVLCKVVEVAAVISILGLIGAIAVTAWVKFEPEMPGFVATLLSGDEASVQTTEATAISADEPQEHHIKATPIERPQSMVRDGIIPPPVPKGPEGLIVR